MPATRPLLSPIRAWERAYILRASGWRGPAGLSNRPGDRLTHRLGRIRAAGATIARMGVLDRFDLHGKVAVVTGGNRGLGEAWVQSLVDVGATVVIAARDDERSRAVAGRFPDQVDVVHLDVRDTADVRRALEEI